DTYKKNMVVTCVVISTNNDGVEVSVDNNATGFIKKIDLSAERSEQKSERFVEGDRIDAKIISIEKSGRRLNLSIKALEIDEREKAIKEYGSTDSGASLGDILGAALGEKEEKK
ncbi:MAG: S1 RNA-binding domain-containing protein, partial [Rickettsiaceae bacterium]|nr:S1 RNA-binding domain-containing protein [Rickettsiaceae bacterium]